ncbi:putative NLI interacting factor like phosphatase [Trypanosoma vivax]|uniref:Mitochondrial import inner membrane translocase subunit TIM50 n=1 Tax=Trypanosoma vivax (strain Y486) TaxID=1055687 RepID=G0U3H2_TRYVY|nr:hypothetical protein TRVL_00387 [Trypanosoma vivax]KAH8613529.1 putative NLI interacting factor like phosphatase [Trypanosoma vivax]CCC50829.1 conserved hypothetical protein [Trypanosoma vivax Y486]
MSKRAPRSTECVLSLPGGCELLRANVFEAGRNTNVNETRVRRRPTMRCTGNQLIAPALEGDTRYTLVLDLDETVVYAREGPLYARAYLKELLHFIKKNFEVIVWTAGEKEYAKSILEEINVDNTIKHLIYRHKSWFTNHDYTKDLKKLGRNIDYVLIVENSPDCVRTNPQNSILVEDFEVHAPDVVATASKRRFTDRTLLLLQEVLAALVESGETVPNFLAKCPLLNQRDVRGSNGTKIRTYQLGKRRKRGAPRSSQPHGKRPKITHLQDE